VASGQWRVTNNEAGLEISRPAFLLEQIRGASGERVCVESNVYWRMENGE
jgi:hypothetical protein